jgi:hypothetical protein
MTLATRGTKTSVRITHRSSHHAVVKSQANFRTRRHNGTRGTEIRRRRATALPEAARSCCVVQLHRAECPDRPCRDRLNRPALTPDDRELRAFHARVKLGIHMIQQVSNRDGGRYRESMAFEPMAAHRTSMLPQYESSTKAQVDDELSGASPGKGRYEGTKIIGEEAFGRRLQEAGRRGRPLGGEEFHQRLGTANGDRELWPLLWVGPAYTSRYEQPSLQIGT